MLVAVVGMKVYFMLVFFLCCLSNLGIFSGSGPALPRHNKSWFTCTLNPTFSTHSHFTPLTSHISKMYFFSPVIFLKHNYFWCIKFHTHNKTNHCEQKPVFYSDDVLRRHKVAPTTGVEHFLNVRFFSPSLKYRWLVLAAFLSTRYLKIKPVMEHVFPDIYLCFFFLHFISKPHLDLPLFPSFLFFFFFFRYSF